MGKKASFEPPAGADVLLYPVEGSNVVLRAATVVYPNWATERFVATEGGFAPVSSSIGSVLTRQGGGYALLLPASGWHYFGSDGILTGGERLSVPDAHAAVHHRTRWAAN